MSIKDGVHYAELYSEYLKLLTENQRSVFEMYCMCDLSLGEIAEQKGVSRQSVSDCLQKCRKQLEGYEAKLKFAKALDELSLEYSAYMTQVTRFIEKEKTNIPALAELQKALNGVHKEFGVEGTANDGAMIGKAFREEE